MTRSSENRPRNIEHGIGQVGLVVRNLLEHVQSGGSKILTGLGISNSKSRVKSDFLEAASRVDSKGNYPFASSGF